MSRVKLKPFALRRWAGLALIKQAVLADLAGVARPMISDWTRGARAIPEDVLARFIKAINERLEREGLAERCSRDKLVLPSPIKPDMRSPDQRKQARYACLLYTSPSPRDGLLARMPSSA